MKTPAPLRLSGRCWSVPRTSHLGWSLLLLLAAWAKPGVAEEPAAQIERGKAIYQSLCVGCHGEGGRGTESYASPLVGDASIRELAGIIDRTMPEGEPETLDAAGAEAVARYVHEAFYSPEAQIRNAPARVELSRLTVRQYRETAADLIGSFTGGGGFEKTTEPGLKAEYFTTRRFRKEDRKVERIDPVVRFDFGEGAPIPDKGINEKDFAIRWTGSLLARETGEYELIIKTTNGVALWLNNERQPLIDGRVRSGNEVEHRERITLLGGRRYRLRLEMFKAENAKEKNAAISLWWRPPHGVEELLPARHLAPGWAPETFVLETPFPPDDRSIGYERGSAVSKEWDQATTDAALEIAGYILPRLNQLAGTKDDAGDRVEKLKKFCVTFAERAFRRPLTDEQKQAFVEQAFKDGNPETAVKRIVLLTLKSPRFLYREIGGEPNDAWNVASRLSYTLWDSLPDQWLREAAAKDQLKTEQQVRQQADRLARDPRAKAKLREFLAVWLRLDHLTDVAKDSALYPEFDGPLVADLRTSLHLFLDDVIESEGASFERLLREDKVWLNGRLAKFYGVDLPADADFQPVALDAGERSGVITHPFLMAGFAYTATSSPIHRGVFLARNVLGRSLKPPPIAVSPVAPDLHPNLTTRERTILQTSPAMCATCHNMINPLGFSLEKFDAVGRLRALEKEKPIDASGGYLTTAGDDRTFAGGVGLAQFLLESDETRAAFARQLFQYLAKQPWPAYGPETLRTLTRKFGESSLNIRTLSVEIAVLTATSPPEPKMEAAKSP